MTLITKTLSGLKGRYLKLTGAVAATLFFAPIPAFGFTFLSLWSFNILTVNAPAPVAKSSDFTSGTELVVDMGKTTLQGATSLHPGAVSFFTAQRDISVGPGGESVNVLRSYQTLLQNASLQTYVYFAPTAGSNTETRIDAVPGTQNSAGVLFGRTFSFQNSPAGTVNLAAGTYTVFVRLKYMENRFGIWDNSTPNVASPSSITISSATGP